MTRAPDDLLRDLDEAIGDGPALPPVTTHLALGRRAVRRRRVVTGLGAAAVVAVLGTTYAVAGSALDSPGEPVPVATAPATTSPTPTPTPTPSPPSTSAAAGAVVGQVQRGFRLGPVGYEGGVLQLGPGVEVLRVVGDPKGPTTHGSLGLVLRYDDRRQYALLVGGAGDTWNGSFEPADVYDGSFRAWLAGKGAPRPGRPLTYDAATDTLRVAPDGPR